MAGTGRREAGGVDWDGSLWVRALVGITQGETEASPSEDRMENLFHFIFCRDGQLPCWCSVLRDICASGM